MPRCHCAQTAASAVFIPPPVFGGEGGRIVSGANDVLGGGCFVETRATPHPALRATLPTSGREKEERASLALRICDAREWGGVL